MTRDERKTVIRIPKPLAIKLLAKAEKLGMPRDALISYLLHSAFRGWVGRVK